MSESCSKMAKDQGTETSTIEPTKNQDQYFLILSQVEGTTGYIRLTSLCVKLSGLDKLSLKALARGCFCPEIPCRLTVLTTKKLLTYNM